jgi:hypothetical protein
VIGTRYSFSLLQALGLHRGLIPWRRLQRRSYVTPAWQPRHAPIPHDTTCGLQGRGARDRPCPVRQAEESTVCSGAGRCSVPSWDEIESGPASGCGLGAVIDLSPREIQGELDVKKFVVMIRIRSTFFFALLTMLILMAAPQASAHRCVYLCPTPPGSAAASPKPTTTPPPKQKPNTALPGTRMTVGIVR